MSEPSPIVLVIDDEVQIRRFLRTGFELNGFVQRNTEHVIQQLEMTFVFLEYQSLFHRQARAPVLLDTPTT